MMLLLMYLAVSGFGGVQGFQLFSNIRSKNMRTYMHTDKDASDALNNKILLRNMPYNELINKIENKKIAKIYFSKKYDEVVSENKEDTEYVYDDYSVTDVIPQVTDRLIDISVKNNVVPVFKIKQEDPSPIQIIAYDTYQFINNFVYPFIFISILVSLARNFFLLSRGNNSNNMGGPFGQNTPGSMNIDIKRDKEMMIKSNITLKSFAGSPEIFEECTEVVSYLKNGTIYAQAGAKIPRGILLEGPPGTGKTLLAKAIASETDANFISITASEFVEVFVGLGAAKVRNLFEVARKNRPCIIFIDEFDSIGRQRGTGLMSNDEREQTLNQLLAEMDGFADNTDILVIGATNRKDTLDAALLRPGRFDRIIKVSLPDVKSRREILKVHAKNKKLSSNVNLDLTAELTTGFSGAQLQNLLNEAAIFTARRGEIIIQNTDILDALEKLLVGLVKMTDDRSEESRRRVAIHEIGHAFICSKFKEYFKLRKVTIQSTYNGAGGYTIYNEHKSISESGLYTKNLYKKQLMIAMGGKAAEYIYYGDDFISVGAIQDLKQANALAERMIGNYGMGETLEPFYNKNIDPTVARSGDSYSEKIKETIDQESLDLVSEALKEAKQLLSDNRPMLDKLVKELMEKNTLNGSEFKDIVESNDIIGNQLDEEEWLRIME